MTFKAALMDQAEYLDRVICNQQIQCVIEVGGRVDEARLARAVRLAYDAEPALGCRFVERRRGPFWQRRDDIDRLVLCTVKDCASAGDVAHGLDEFLLEPGDPRRDPLVRVRVLRGETDTVCVKVDHIVADTGGAKDLIYLLCEIYERLGDYPGYEPAANARGDRSLRQVLERVSLPDKLRSLRYANPSAPAWGFPFKGFGCYDQAFAVRRIEPEEFARLKEFGRGRGATVNDCLLAAYFRAFFELARPGPGKRCTIRVPIDLRRYLPGEKAGAVCNLSGQLYATLAMVPGEEFAGTLDRVCRVMGALKANTPGVGAAIVFGAMASPGTYLTSKAYRPMVVQGMKTGKWDPYLSNMGVLSPERLRFGGAPVTGAYFVSPLQCAPGFLLGASTFNERMTLTIGYADASANGPAVERLLDMVCSDLTILEPRLSGADNVKA